MRYTGITGIIRITRITSIIRTYVRPRESRGPVKNGFFFFFLRAPSPRPSSFDSVGPLGFSASLVVRARLPFSTSSTSLLFSSLLFSSLLFSSLLFLHHLPHAAPPRVYTRPPSLVSVLSHPISLFLYNSAPLLPLPILLVLVVLPCGPTNGRFNVRDFFVRLTLPRPPAPHFLLARLFQLPRPAARLVLCSLVQLRPVRRSPASFFVRASHFWLSILQLVPLSMVLVFFFFFLFFLGGGGGGGGNFLSYLDQGLNGHPVVGICYPPCNAISADFWHFCLGQRRRLEMLRKYSVFNLFFVELSFLCWDVQWINMLEWNESFIYFPPFFVCTNCNFLPLRHSQQPTE